MRAKWPPLFHHLAAFVTGLFHPKEKLLSFRRRAKRARRNPLYTILTHEQSVQKGFGCTRKRRTTAETPTPLVIPTREQSEQGGICFARRRRAPLTLPQASHADDVRL